MVRTKKKEIVRNRKYGEKDKIRKGKRKENVGEKKQI